MLNVVPVIDDCAYQRRHIIFECLAGKTGIRFVCRKEFVLVLDAKMAATGASNVNSSNDNEHGDCLRSMRVIVAAW